MFVRSRNQPRPRNGRSVLPRLSRRHRWRKRRFSFHRRRNRCSNLRRSKLRSVIETEPTFEAVGAVVDQEATEPVAASAVTEAEPVTSTPEPAAEFLAPAPEWPQPERNGHESFEDFAPVTEFAPFVAEETAPPSETRMDALMAYEETQQPVIDAVVTHEEIEWPAVDSFVAPEEVEEPVAERVEEAEEIQQPAMESLMPLSEENMPPGESSGFGREYAGGRAGASYGRAGSDGREPAGRARGTRCLMKFRRASRSGRVNRFLTKCLSSPLKPPQQRNRRQRPRFRSRWSLRRHCPRLSPPIPAWTELGACANPWKHHCSSPQLFQPSPQFFNQQYTKPCLNRPKCKPLQ